MKKTSGQTVFKVALYGMDPRSYKTMELYLQSHCQGLAEVVDASEADIDLLDADFATAGEILETRRQQTPDRPIVLLSLQTLKIADTYFVPKPVNAEQLINVFEQIRSASRAKLPVVAPATDTTAPLSPTPKPESLSHTVQPAISARPTEKKRALFAANEGGYTAFLGTVSGIDFNDPEQLRNADFDPRNYLLGYIQSAYRIARHEKQAVQLNSVWKSVFIFPDSQQIWLDADDKQLRAFSGVEQNKISAGSVARVTLDAEAARAGKDPDKFQDMEAFLWKLTVWTSKGRFPVGLDLEHPVYLKHWPNFTRLLLTPEALRIAALLVRGPRSPLSIIEVLNVSPHYVFAFISACMSIGILGKSERRIDETLLTEPPKHTKKQGVLAKILHKLRSH